jgi:hypothetical protein
VISANFTLAARSSDVDKCRYFEKMLLKTELGRKSAGMFIKWAELELIVHGIQNAVIVLKKVSCLSNLSTDQVLYACQVLSTDLARSTTHR